MSSAKPFQFKQFTVHHDRCAMKVGTDAVLLGAWINISRAKRILDIGTGSGVIALMAAQRTNDDAIIDAIEIEESDAEQAKENVLNSPWPNKIFVHQKSLQELENSIPYDLIFSNPPFFNNSLLPPSKQRTRVRHTHSLSYQELIENSLRLMAKDGKLAVILPVEEGNKFKFLAEENGLHIIRQLAFYSRKEKPQERWLMEFSKQYQPIHSETLFLYESGQEWSNEYRKLTREFYLDR